MESCELNFLNAHYNEVQSNATDLILDDVDFIRRRIYSERIEKRFHQWRI